MAADAPRQTAKGLVVEEGSSDHLVAGMIIILF